MNSTPLISIIIPTRNRFEYIKLLIEDILKQDVTNYEIIVVDQSETLKNLEDCNHIITDTLGPCISRNIGVKSAKGEILVFLDDDARINSDFIREITTPILNDRFDVVAGAICTPNGEYLYRKHQFLELESENFIKVLTSNPDGPNSRITLGFPAGCAAILKSVFVAVDGFEESFDPTGAGEDRDMALKLYKQGFPIWYNANAKLLHKVAPEGGTRDLGSRSIMLDVHTYKMCKKHFSEKLAQTLKQIILEKYKKSFYNSLFSLKHVRTKYRIWRQLINLLSK